MDSTNTPELIRLAIPKGRMQKGVLSLLSDAGFPIQVDERSYRPTLSRGGFSIKLLKPHNIISMLHQGSRDLGFAGADWVSEFASELVEILDTGLDPVRIVAAAPEELVINGKLPKRPLRVATEYTEIASRWVKANGIDATIIKTFGATEVFPPEDADVIVDNSATGSTLKANHLALVDVLMTSSTRLYASPRVMEIPEMRNRIEDFALNLQSVLQARTRVLVEVNVSRDNLEKLVAVMPSMRKPTVAMLFDESGYAVKAAVPRAELHALIPKIRACGGTDILVFTPSQILP
jgi:ATP phosphoribosyltransferase